MKYGRAYLVGALFFIVTNAMAVNAVFGHLTAAQLSALTRPELIIGAIKVIALAGTNLLAFFNQTVARADLTAPHP